MDLLNEVDGDGDRGSFEDSDRFEEDDSVVSWSESESQINNWRGWDNIKTPLRPKLKTKETTVSSLVDLCCKTVAQNLPFELIELSNDPIPGDLQLKVISMSFPMDVEDIRLYSTLASGSADQFSRGEDLYNYKAVHDCLQIGFVLTARVHTEMTMTGPPGLGSNSVGGKPLNKFRVSIMFDRLKITSCSCTCMNGSQWCAHAVAVCLLRIFNPDQVQYRLPVSESLNRLTRDHLQKLIQYLLCQSPPTDILPAAQTILDQLLSPGPTEINESHGAPDLTCGGEIDSVAQWCLDEHSLADNVRKILSKFCVPAPVVYSDPAYLNANLPAPAQEYQNLLRPLRGREPEGIWNLLCIIRAMFIRRDNNAVKLLRILTEALLELDKIVCWWYNVKMSLLSVYSRLPHSSSSQMNMVPNQYAAAKFCDEVVTLWRLAALNPALNRHERDEMASTLHDYHKRTVQQALKSRQANLHHHHRSHHHHHHHPYFPGPNASSSPPTNSGSCQGQARESWQASNRFPGFKPAVEACNMDWGEFETWRSIHMPSLRPIPLPPHPAKPSRSRSLSAATSGSGPSKEMRKDGRRSRHASVRSATTPANNQGALSTPAGGGKLLSSMEHSSSDGSSSEGFCEGGERLFAPVASGTATTSVSSAPASEGNVWLASTSSITAASSTVGVAEDSSSADESGYLRRETLTASSLHPQPSLSQLSSAADDMSEENFIFRLFAFCVALRGHGYEPESQALSYILADDLLSRSNDTFDSLSAISDEIIRTQQRLPTNLGTPGKSGSGGGGGSGGKRYSPGGPGSSGGSRGAASSAANTFQEAAETVYPRGMTDHTTYVTKVLGQMQILVNSLVDIPRVEKDAPSLAFQLCLYGICYPRPPAKNKAYEVKLFHLESELLTQLRKLPVYAPEVELLRVKTEEMIEGKLAHSPAYLPYSLAIYSFDIFTRFNTVNIPGLSVTANEMKDLAFRCALKALEMKSELSEQYHPILIEGQRRQRDELALMLIVHYKDDEVHLSRVMESLLDRKLNSNFKAPSLHACLTHNTHSLMNYSEPDTPHSTPSAPTGALASTPHLPTPYYATSSSASVTSSLPASYSRATPGRQSMSSSGLPVSASNTASSSSGPSNSHGGRTSVTRQSAEYANYQMLVNYNKHRAPNIARRQQRTDDAGQRGDTEDSSALEDEVDERLRCLDLRRGRDTTSSAPDTTSSDNSPTLPRRASRAALVAAAPQAAGTDGGSSSDGVSSSESEPPPQPPPQPLMGPGIRGNRGLPSHPVKTIHSAFADPNQPSESMAYHMFELARSVLSRAGGAASSMAVFNHQANLAMDPGGPHRQLHLCAFQLGLYALGLYNSVNSTWQSRTYSSHVSWISNQVMDIGATALCILIHTWKHHLTPPEVANIADKATNTRDSATQSAAAELCLAALAECQTLNPSEIQRALRQCKEKSQEMLERGLSAVEKGATNTAGGVYPEVLFYVARQWYDLYELASVTRNSMTRRSSAESEHQQVPNVSPQPLPPNPQQHHALLHHPGSIPVQHSARHPTFQQQHPHQQQQQLYLSQAAVVNGVPWHPQCPVPPSPAPYSTYFYPNQLAVAAVAAACQARPPNPVTTAQPVQNPAVTLQQQQSAMAHLAVIAQIPTMGRYAGYTSPAAIGHSHFHNTSAGVMIANHGGRQVPAYIPVSGPPHGALNTPPAALSAPIMCGSSGRRHHHHHHHHHHHRGDRCQHYLQKAFHCAIRAMKAFYVSTTTSNRQSEQHGSASGSTSSSVVSSGSSVSNNLRFSASPPHSDDVKWTLVVAKLLGHGAVTEYCNLIVGCIQSPFVLEEICKEVLQYYNKSNSQNGGSGGGSPAGPGPQDTDPSPNPVVAATAAAVAAVVSGATHHHPHPVSGPPNTVPTAASAQVPSGASAPPPSVQVGSTPPADVSKLVSNVHNLYWQCIEHRLSHLAQQEWDDLVAIILAAHKAFRSLPPADPNLNWNNLLARIRNHPKCKKELWSRILSGIRTIQIG